jgi:hypothetical protein
MSGYAQLPQVEPESARQPTLGAGSRVAERMLSTAKVGADKVVDTLGDGLRIARAELSGPGDAHVDALVAASDLPEVSADNSLQTLLRRLDKEADLWRALAVRELAHIAWANRIAHLASTFSMLGAMALAAVAAFESLLAANTGRSVFLIVGAGILALGALVATLVSASVRRSQRDIVREGLVRADLAELRLHRIAITIAAAHAKTPEAKEALAKLEREAAG